MKLLVLAQTPPPLHGQSLMVQTLLDGLPGRGIAVHHVNLRLSRDAADIGRWRVGKLFATLGGAFAAIAARFRHGCDTFYYVPAPGKRGALYRDWLVMLLCRPFFKNLVLHWHAPGLDEWLIAEGTAPERFLTRALLGRAQLALALTPTLRANAAAFAPRYLAIVANGIADPGVRVAAFRAEGGPFRVLFLGAVTAEKGAGVLLDAVQQLWQRGENFAVTFAGDVGDDTLRARLGYATQEMPKAVQLAGFVSGEAKAALLANCDCVCLPTYYSSEGQPLVALEALAADRPLVVTAWRGLPDTVPPGVPIVPPRDAMALADALLEVRAQSSRAGAHREFFLAHYTIERHLASLAAALRQLEN